MVSSAGRIAAVALAVTCVAVPGARAGAQPDAASPSWSPDGSEVAFAFVESSRYRIVTAPAAGGGAARTIRAAKNADGCCDPMAWAAGNRILYVANYTLMSVPAGGGKPTPLFSSTPWFVLSPNRETAAFTDGCGCGHAPDAIGLVNVRGGKPRVIAKPRKASDEIDGFSPDGTEIVFTRYRAVNDGLVGKPILMAARVRGGAPVPLSRSGLVGAQFLPHGAQRVQWSPDGRWIAFVRSLKLEVVSTAGGVPRVLATHFGADAFAWSPDSTKLAYDCCSNQQTQRLLTVDPQGAHNVALWSDTSFHYLSMDSLDWPQWSPDGTKLVFMARSGAGYPPTEVWTVGADGSGLTRIG